MQGAFHCYNDSNLYEKHKISNNDSMDSLLLSSHFLLLLFLVLLSFYEILGLLPQFFGRQQLVILLIIFEVIESQHACSYVGLFTQRWGQYSWI